MKIYHIMGAAPYYTNCFMIIDNQDTAVLIDGSAPWSKISQILNSDNAKLAAVLLTHGHHDHRESLAEIIKNTQAPVYVGLQDKEQFNLDDVVCYQDMSTMEFGEIKLFVFSTPGHTPGGYCIKCEDMLFSGDTLFAGTVGRTDLPGGDYDELMRSLQKIVQTVKTDVKVLPGHAHFSTLEQEKEQNPYLKEMLKCL